MPGYIRYLAVAAPILALAACTTMEPRAPIPAAGSSAVNLIAVGDTPYRPQDVAPFEALLRMIDASPRDITIHVGDIKGGGTPCTDEVFIGQFAYLKNVSGALVLTPGDNEWTDCHLDYTGGYDPTERLSYLRKLFYADDRSLGSQPIRVEQQSSLDKRYATFVENARWRKKGVRFITAHVVGSNNGLSREIPGALAEYTARNEASSVWIREGFDLAEQEGAQAVVLAIHADPFVTHGEGGGFRDTLAAISDGASAFGGRVLVIHGDGHIYTVDTPFEGPDGRVLKNVVRLEVPGAVDVRAVRVRIDPEAARVFTFEPFGPG